MSSARPSKSSGTPSRARPASTPSTDTPAAQGPPSGTIIDRRLGLERRLLEDAAGTGLERRRSAGRRLSDFTRSAEEGQMTREQFLFLMAIDAFKKSNERQFPTWTDVLEVIRLLGYRKTMPSELNLTNAEDWSEPHDAPAAVRPERWEERAEADAERERRRAA